MIDLDHFAIFKLDKIQKPPERPVEPPHVYR